MRDVLLVLLLTLSAPTLAQTDFKVMKLEQDVRTLERQVDDLKRQLGELQRRANQPGNLPARPDQHQQQPSASPAWLVTSNWERLQPGMSELQVIELLGPPTSTRAAASSRTLFYAMEIGASGFLGGNVRLGNGKVVEVVRPALR